MNATVDEREREGEGGEEGREGDEGEGLDEVHDEFNRDTMSSGALDVVTTLCSQVSGE